MIVARVEPHRLMLDSECWWDVGVAGASERPETRELAAEHARGRRLQRFYGSREDRRHRRGPARGARAFAPLGEIVVRSDGTRPPRC